MNILRRSAILLCVLTVLALGSLASCEFFNPTALGFLTIEYGGNEVPYGATVDEQVLAANLPFTGTFELGIDGGEGPISIRAISDITDQDDPSWHQGKMTVAHSSSGSSFEIKAEENFSFTITLDATATAGNTYEMEVAIQNNDGIVPNPHLLRFRVQVN